jgi:hypothetical protein
MKTAQLEDFLSEGVGFDDMAVSLAVGSYLGGQEILQNKKYVGSKQEIKYDGSTVGKLDTISGEKIAEYINSSDISKKVRFKSEEQMPFYVPDNWKFAGIFDDLDGSINPMIGGANLNYVGVGGVIHENKLDNQLYTAAYLPFLNSKELFIAEKGKGTYVINLSGDKLKHNKIELSSEPAQKNTLLESGWVSQNTLDAERALQTAGFYYEIGKEEKGNAFAKDRVTGGIFQTVSGIRDSRQVVLNIAPSHQADYCYLLLQEAGAEVVGQRGHPMDSTSNAMLSISPSFKGDAEALKEKFRMAMGKMNKNGYQGWNPEAPLTEVTK